jgi:hypothetical protein
MPISKPLALMGVASTTAILLAHPICALLFGCGCSPVWALGVGTCDLMPHTVGTHQACPWCASSNWVILFVFGVPTILAAALGVFLNAKSSMMPALIITVLSTVIGLFLVGIVHGLAKDFEPPQSRFSVCGEVLNSKKPQTVQP